MPLALTASVCQSQIRLILSRSRMRPCPMARLSPPEFISAALTTQAALHQDHVPRHSVRCRTSRSDGRVWRLLQELELGIGFSLFPERRGNRHWWRDKRDGLTRSAVGYGPGHSV